MISLFPLPCPSEIESFNHQGLERRNIKMKNYTCILQERHIQAGLEIDANFSLESPFNIHFIDDQLLHSGKCGEEVDELGEWRRREQANTFFPVDCIVHWQPS